jgi:hypothetical protein
MPYANEQDEALARTLGYSVRRSHKSGSSFSKDDRNVWSTRIGWQTADLDNGSYRNHEIFAELSDALKRPL